MRARPGSRRAGLAALICLTVSAAAMAGPDWAGEGLEPEAVAPSASPTVTSRDLIGLRDLGALSLSPDGRWLAFCVYQAVIDRDGYRLRWFIAPADGSTAPAAIGDTGGQPLIGYGFGLPYSSILNEPAKWSPDSRRFAFRIRDGSRADLWVADRSTGAVVRVSSGRIEVDAFAWLASGELAYRTGLDEARYRQAVAQEARHGWLLDARIPLFAAREPSPTRPDCGATPRDGACEIATFVVSDPGRAPPRPADPAQTAMLKTALDARPTGPGMADLRDVGPARADGARAMARVADPADLKAWGPELRLSTDAAGARPCRASACASAFLREMGWARDGRSIWFLRGESGQGRADGAPRDLAGLYEWTLSDGHVRRVLQTGLLLDGCLARGAVAYCEAEAPTRPRRIVAIDLDDGAVRPFADPNPGFAAKAFPTLRKLQLQDQAGEPAFGWVVYPNDYVPGRRYPLVVTQYDAKGFLRGQVGGEYPIFPLAAEGFVVLSIDRPEDWEGRRHLDAVAVFHRGLSDDLRDRRSTFSVNESAVDQLIRDGLVDPGRMAITGLSAGTETLHYTLQHTDRYAAAIADSGTHDLTFLALVPPGPRRDLLMSWFGSTSLIPRADNPIRQLAWSERPERLKTPLLINTGANQALLGFEGIQALQQAGRPVEVRIFPEEMHIVYRPQALAGIHENNIAWLKFWLRGEEDPRPDWADQYARWRAMRDRLRVGSSLPPAGGGGGQMTGGFMA